MKITSAISPSLSAREPQVSTSQRPKLGDHWGVVAAATETAGSVVGPEKPARRGFPGAPQSNAVSYR